MRKMKIPLYNNVIQENKINRTYAIGFFACIQWSGLTELINRTYAIGFFACIQWSGLTELINRIYGIGSFACLQWSGLTELIKMTYSACMQWRGLTELVNLSIICNNVTFPYQQILTKKGVTEQIKKVPSEGKTDTKSAGQITNSICTILITVTKMGDQIKDTTTECLIANINKFASRIIDMINVNLMWQKAQTEVGCMKDVENETNEKHIIYYYKESCSEMTKYKEIEASKGMSLYIEQLEVEYLDDALYRSGHKDFFNAIPGGIQASECSMNRPINHNYVCSDDDRTTYDSQEGKRIGKSGSMIQIPSFEVNTDIESDKSWSTFESAMIILYRNVIRNETSRMMSSIDMVGFKAEHLFGLERSRIFFDLLDEELCHFGSAGAISKFVPNMAESTVRQHVISFFEHANDTTSRLMTLLLSCPCKILQQMPVQNFISLMKTVIKSSLKTKSKGRKKLSLEENIYIMVDPKEFERAHGEEIPEDVLNRLRRGDEMVVHKFVHTRLDRHQPSDRKKNRPIHSIFFPSDCRLFIYIPTENGSYWHQSDMRRADGISRHEFKLKVETKSNNEDSAVHI